MAKLMGRRPSEVFGLKDEFIAWCFDRAVLSFGIALEERLRKVAENQKTQKAAERRATMELNKWLASDGDPVSQSGRFRDPFAEMAQRG